MTGDVHHVVIQLMMMICLHVSRGNSRINTLKQINVMRYTVDIKIM